MEEKTVLKLIDKAKQAGEKAYCPYSECPIGACVLTQSGMIFGGCNIECASFSESRGALEVAIAKAVSEGGANINIAVIYCEERMAYPTGSERQLLREFTTRARIICASKENIEEFTIQELLPFAETKEQENV